MRVSVTGFLPEFTARQELSTGSLRKVQSQSTLAQDSVSKTTKG